MYFKAKRDDEKLHIALKIIWFKNREKNLAIFLFFYIPLCM